MTDAERDLDKLLTAESQKEFEDLRHFCERQGGSIGDLARFGVFDGGFVAGYRFAMKLMAERAKQKFYERHGEPN